MSIFPSTHGTKKNTMPYKEPHTQPPDYEREKATLLKIVADLEHSKMNGDTLFKARRTMMKALYNGGRGLKLEQIAAICGITKQAVSAEIKKA